MSRVKDVIRDRELYAVEATSSVAGAVRRMAELKVGAILVLRNGDLCGVFSERDLMVRVVLPGLDAASTPLASVMSTDILTVDEEATLDEAMERMREHNCRHLPVTRDKALVGFLSMRDVMHSQLAAKDEELHHMRTYIQGAS